jgi:His-Xaa-Ser system radical SAM maturase HxsC
MIRLSGRATPVGLAGEVHPDVWRVCRTGEDGTGGALACVSTRRDAAGDPNLIYLAPQPGVTAPAPGIQLGRGLAHVAENDILHISPDGSRVSVLWKSTAVHNSLLLTEQCDNYCLMCSQPPKTRDDTWLFERAKQVVRLLPPTARSLGLTGGEPTLHADALIGLLQHCRDTAPWLQLHLLSNGRRFADISFSQCYAAVGLQDIMVGIPLYAPEPGLHDFIVQASGAFEETVHGILNLATLGQCIELRVVIQRHTVPVLGELAVFIARNLPFVDQVALMGLEMTGLARPNSAEVWIDPADYQAELADATLTLAAAGIGTKIFNHQLCVLDEQLWPFAVRSISDWKNDYLDICANCSVQDVCGGVFATSGSRLSAALRPIRASAAQMTAEPERL